MALDGRQKKQVSVAYTRKALETLTVSLERILLTYLDVDSKSRGTMVADRVLECRVCEFDLLLCRGRCSLFVLQELIRMPGKVRRRIYDDTTVVVVFFDKGASFMCVV